MLYSRFIEFLRNARMNAAYEVARPGRVRNLPRGPNSVLPYSEGDLTYEDTWSAPSPGLFGGNERVSEGGLGVWFRIYAGTIADPDLLNDEKEDRFYENVLKPCLRRFPPEEPFKRGPPVMEIDDYIYRYFFQGTAAGFYDMEEIDKVTGRKAYVLFSRGGFSKASQFEPRARLLD
jgi:hypothetical protein